MGAERPPSVPFGIVEMSCNKPVPAYYDLISGSVVFNSKRLKDYKSFDFIYLPCGKCLGCRSDRALDWAVRCVCELQCHDVASFVTLTYSPEELLTRGNSLLKKDFQDFMKRLRFHVDCPLRFYACGEYGSRTFRPHFHAIIFGWWPSDAVQFSESGLFGSEFLSRVWSHGFVSVGSVTLESCRYVAGYVSKKLFDDKKYSELGLVPPFSLQSRRPGIGHSFIEKYGDELFRLDKVYCNGQLYPLPPYFDKWLNLRDERRFIDLKRNRVAALAERSEGEIYRVGEAREYNKKSKLKERDF